MKLLTRSRGIMIDLEPKSRNKQSIPHLFCPGCGHALILKTIGKIIDEKKLAKNTAFGIDIGCSLLAWNFFDVDTVQTHHGRTAPVMVGYKMAEPDRLAVAYMGDGAAYAIGLQSILHAALRNDPITVIVINNENYAMTGGQMSPETEHGVITETSPEGKEKSFGPGLKGPELISSISADNAFIARTTVANPFEMKKMLTQAFDHQLKNNAFSFLEILSICPTNWKTNAKDSLERVHKMAEYYQTGVITKQ